MIECASKLDPKNNVKWSKENMVRRLKNFHDNNDISLFEAANNRADLGHPKAPPAKYPLSRFFQEHKTEVFEIDCNGNGFEMFEDMRVYVERNGRPYNYLPTVTKLNEERERDLVKEEAECKDEVAKNQAKTTQVKQEEREALEKLQQQRLVQIKKHMSDLEQA